MLANHKYPTLHAQKRLNDVLEENNHHKVETRNTKALDNGLVEFEAKIGGIFEKHILTQANEIYMYWEYHWHHK